MNYLDRYGNNYLLINTKMKNVKITDVYNMYQGVQ